MHMKLHIVHIYIATYRYMSIQSHLYNIATITLYRDFAQYCMHPNRPRNNLCIN